MLKMVNKKKFKVFTAWVISSNHATTHHDGNIIHQYLLFVHYFPPHFQPTVLFELYFCPNDVIINVKSNRIWSLTSYFSQSLFYSCIKKNSKYLFNLFIYRLHFAYPTTTNNEKVSSLPIIEYLKILLNAEQSFNRFVTCSKQMLSCYTLLHQLEDSCSFWIQ